jgi:hypothetical protein
MDGTGPHSDPLAGADGTAPPAPETDPATGGAAHPSDLRLPAAMDPDGVAAWMDADRERSLQPWRPEPTEARDVPTPRPIPTQRPHRTLPPEVLEPSPVAPGARAGEPAWRQERREEAEFRAQFGEWRADRPRAPHSGGGFLGGVKLGAPLLVLIAVLIAVAALALHL